MNSVRLRGEAVAKRFGRVAALRGIDFEIEPGEALAILGANGAGKSTLLRILAGLSRPSGGRFEALAESNAESPSSLRREVLRGEVGYVGHATLVYRELTARENLAFAARLQGHKAATAALDALLDELGLLEFADRRAGTFSRGMAQRLAIARATVHDPSILLLDEPFTGLDEASAERLSGRLASRRGGGRTLIVVTHDPQRGVELADRALLLHRGEIIAKPAREAGRGDGSEFSADALRASLSRAAHSARESAA